MPRLPGGMAFLLTLCTNPQSQPMEMIQMTDNRNRSITRRDAVKSAGFPLLAGASLGGDRPQSKLVRTVDARIFRPLIARWRPATSVSSPCRTVKPIPTTTWNCAIQLDKLFGEADSRFLAIERKIGDTLIATVGYAPAAVQVDDVIVSVTTLAGLTDGDTMVSVVELGLITRAR